MTDQLKLLLYPEDEIGDMVRELRTMQQSIDKTRRGLFARQTVLASEISALRAEISELRMQLYVANGFQKPVPTAQTSCDIDPGFWQPA